MDFDLLTYIFGIVSGIVLTIILVAIAGTVAWKKQGGNLGGTTNNSNRY